MKTVYRILVTTGFFAVLSGCDPTQIIYSPLHTFSARPDRLECAVIVAEPPTIVYGGDVVNEFGQGDTDSLIRVFFMQELPRQLETRTFLQPLNAGLPIEQYATDEIILPIEGEGEIRYKVPADGTIIHFKDSEPAFVLIIGKVKIHSVFYMSISTLPGSSIPGTSIPGSTMYGRAAGSGGFSTQKDLVISAKFAFWDNRAGKLVSHGFVEAVDENRFAVTLEDWQNAMTTFTQKMFAGSVFTRVTTAPVSPEYY